jgi:hypothetical protein
MRDGRPDDMAAVLLSHYGAERALVEFGCADPVVINQACAYEDVTGKHKHKCVVCGGVWEHKEPSWHATEEERREAHTCPFCFTDGFEATPGRGMNKYLGAEEAQCYHDALTTTPYGAVQMTPHITEKVDF